MSESEVTMSFTNGPGEPDGTAAFKKEQQAMEEYIHA